MQRCVIVSAASISNFDKIKKQLKKDDFYIFCDGGLNHAEKLGVTPSLIIGDFDSAEKPVTNIETIQLPVEKDDTDTFFAVKEALKRGFRDFLLLGVIGGRFDHSLCNVSALIYLHNHGAKAELIDDYSTMKIISSEQEIVKDCSYFSLMNICGDAENVTIRNAKYPVEKGTIKAEFALGVSNENLPGKNAEVSVGKGLLLLVEVN